jgi:hypothetical protein
MEPMRTRSRKSNLAKLRLGWLNAPRRGGSQLDQNRARLRRQLPRTTRQTDTGPSIVDLLDVNAELSYTTVVEGLEEFLYQRELQICV